MVGKMFVERCMGSLRLEMNCQINNDNKFKGYKIHENDSNFKKSN